MRAPHFGLQSLALAFVVAALTTACAAAPGAVEPQHPEAQDPVLGRASTDLVCPEARLTLVASREDRKGVRGCGLEARYERSCPSCAWMLDGAIARVDHRAK
jgi:hypothetical protein